MKKTKNITSIWFMTLVIIGTVLALNIFFFRTTENSAYQAKSTLMENASEQAIMLETAINGQFIALETFAAGISSADVDSIPGYLGSLKAAAESAGFYEMYIVDAKGNGWLSSGDRVDVSDRAYFRKSVSGERAVELVTGKINDIDLLMLSTAIKNGNGEIIGVIAGSYNEQNLRSLLFSSSFSGEGYSYVIDAEGEIVIGTDSSKNPELTDSIFQIIGSKGYKSDVTADDLRRYLAEGRSVSFSYTIPDKERLVVIAPIGTIPVIDTHWFMVNVVPQSVVTDAVASQRRNGIEQMLVTIIFGGAATLLFIYSEISNRKKLENESKALRAENQRFNVVYESSTISVWQYDFATKEVWQDSRSRSKNGLGEVIRGVPESLILNGYVHPDSARAYHEMYKRILSGAKSAEGVFRLQTEDRQGYRYECIRYTTLFDERGRAYGAIGVSEDVTERRQQEMAYAKWQKEVESICDDSSAVFGWNLTKDIFDGAERSTFRAEKTMVPKVGLNALVKTYVDSYVSPEDAHEILHLMDRERLIVLYHKDIFSCETDYRELNDKGEYVWMRLSVQMVQYPDSDEIKAYIISRNINEEKEMALELIARSEQDALTSALNRDVFENRVNKLISESEAGSCHALLMMDIDGFKAVNDTFGHDIGDRMLEELIRCIRSVLRYDDIVGRMGGDEFVVCMKDVSYDAVIEKKAQQMCEMLRRKLSDEVMVSLSLGISVFPRDGLTFEQLYKAADTALYYTKENGKDGYNFYNAGMSNENRSKFRNRVQYATMSAPLPKKRMLIVDDADGDRELLCGIFSDEFAVITARSGEGALSQIKRYGSSISIILLNLHMPGMGGFDVMKRMRNDSMLVEFPVIIVTSDDSFETYLDAISAGASDIITKPVNEHSAKVKVRSVLMRIVNEKIRIQNSYLRLQGAEEERYRRVLSATGTVVIIHDWQNDIFSYDPEISGYIGGNFNSRTLDRVLTEDGIACEEDVRRLCALEQTLIDHPEKDREETNVTLMIPKGEKHIFKVQLIRMSGEYELTEKILFTFNDINDTALAENALKRRAEHDPLTGLYNRETFFAKAAELVYSERSGSYIMAAFDINNFKLINDQYGQAVGDRVLQRLAVLGNACIEEIGGITCRISADNFAGLYPSDVASVDYITERRTLIIQELGLKVSLSFSVGRYVVEDLSIPVSAMYDRASMAKKSIKGRYDVHTAYYNAGMREEFLREQMIIGSMEQALQNGQIKVYFQPQYNHATGAMVGAEALARWQHPEYGTISPGEFIPIFEKNGFVYRLDAFVWEEVCRLLRNWIDEGCTVMPISVNVSRFDIYQEDFFETITGIAEKYDISTELLHLEITETAFSSTPRQIIKIVKKLIDYGFVVEIDDFGSGYSSLNTLKDVPAQVLKLDMRFMEDSGENRRGGSIVNSVIRMARWLFMPVIAEGVETVEQANYLQSIGCNYVQGYLYAKPMPLESFEKLMEECPKELSMESLKTLSTLDPNAFWDPKSRETLIFNSYVGGAAVAEYSGGKLEYLRVNEKFMRELRTQDATVEDILNADPMNYFTGGYRQFAQEAIERAIKTDDEAEFEARLLIDETKGPLWLKVRLRVIGRSPGRSLFYIAIENITEAKCAEQKIKETGEQLETIMDTITSGVCAYAIEDYYSGYVLFANTQYYSMLGYTENQFKAEVKNIFDIINPEEKNRVIRHTMEAMGNKGRLISYDYRAIRRDGSTAILHGDSKIISVSGETNPVLLVITTDVTDKIEESPFGVVLINRAANEYELITSDVHIKGFPVKGCYDDLAKYLTSLVPDEAGKKKLRKKIELESIVRELEQNNGAYRFNYYISDNAAGGLREVTAKYSDEQKNQIIMTVRLKNS